MADLSRIPAVCAKALVAVVGVTLMWGGGCAAAPLVPGDAATETTPSESANVNASASNAKPVKVLFVGNSFTFGRVDPVLSYNAAQVHDLTAAFNALDPRGTNSHPAGTPGEGSFEPHPWGGVPGVFKKMTEQAGLNYEVSLSTRNALPLRGHFLNTPGAAWNLRGNVASQAWQKVVLQELSDGTLPEGKGKSAHPQMFNVYADLLERFIHQGQALQSTEAQWFGGMASCQVAGLSADTCERVHVIAANPHASAQTQVYLVQTWARPDMVEAHVPTHPDRASPDGAPLPRQGQALTPRYYANLAEMSRDLRVAADAKVAGNLGFAGVVPVGDAFQRAVDTGVAQGRGFFASSDATTATATAAGLDLWWLDRIHASKFGSYLSALTLFGRLTGLNPLSLGASETAARDLGITPAQAQALQEVAAAQLAASKRLP
ncbi:SGNH/GDSL hydrolase family protein [Roseateles koreensis]|uniref:SGNH/GDSL hydrolase family protein n=1 Tax=Roseateles koreensis TaxID=2987526 RepID=A0ABT5KPI5_9BURK|nr:hypothetical protein [Roseateles koreensis]MDC8784829.1 hypothetical protein [Roseateles koreensis]